MNGIAAFKQSWDLLTPRDHRILVGLTGVQMATALLDLVGILLVGVVVATGVASATGDELPGTIRTLLTTLGVSGEDQLAISFLLAILAAIVLLAKSAINIPLSRLSLRFLANRQAAVARQLSKGLLSQPLLQIQQRSSQDVVYALTDGVGYAILIVVGQGLVFVVEAALLVTLGVGLATLDLVLTLFTVAFFIIVASVVQLSLSKWARRQGRRTGLLDIASFETVQEALMTFRELLVNGRRGAYIEKLGQLRKEAARVQADLQFINMLPKHVFEVALVVGGGLLAVSQLMTKDAAAAVATVAVFLAAGSRIVPSLLRLQGALISVQSGSAAATPTLQLAGELADSSSQTQAFFDPTQAPTSQSLSHEGFEASLLVEGVDFTYPAESTPALRAVSFFLPADGSLALVGPSGSGKSTLADMILGVITPAVGKVSIGGQSPSVVAREWPGAVAYVPQLISLVNGSIRENVALGLRPDDVDDQLVIEALERAHLLDLVDAAPEGVLTQVGEAGVKLSGGERQRLGIARALYTRPKLLVLDEATSALDAATEALIGETLDDLQGSVTTVTVAHRLATIKHCDQILFMDNGCIAASGTFDELREKSQRFRHHAILLGL